MKKVSIPNFGELLIKNVIFDVNGTIQFSGKLPDEIVAKFEELKKFYDVYLLSADTRGNLNKLTEKLGVKGIKIRADNITEADAKNNVLLDLGKEVTVAVGNGNNDSLMLKNAIIGIAILGSEGAASKSIINSHVVVPSPIDAINFLLDEKIMIATLRL